MDKLQLLEKFIQERKLEQRGNISQEVKDEISGMEAALKSVKQDDTVCYDTENEAFKQGFSLASNLLMW